MVNFRFHIVSIIAVFLALGLGILMGSAVVNGAIVDRLDREIDQVRTESDRLRESNQRTTDELDRSNQFLDASAAYSVDGRLTDVPVVVLAERDVSADAVNAAADLLRVAGAEVPAVFWLEARWTLETEEDVQALREAVDLLGGAASVRTRALARLAARLTGSVEAAPDGGEVPPDLVGRLVDAGFLTVETVEGDDVDLTAFPSRPGRALLVTGTDTVFAEVDMTLEATGAFIEVDAPTVVAEVFVAEEAPDAPQRGDAVAVVRTNDELAAVVSTVDDLDLVAGRIAAVIALQDLATGAVGHYGFGDGATSSLPLPSGEQ